MPKALKPVSVNRVIDHGFHAVLTDRISRSHKKWPPNEDDPSIALTWLRVKPVCIFWWNALLDAGEPNLAELGKLHLLAQCLGTHKHCAMGAEDPAPSIVDDKPAILELASTLSWKLAFSGSGLSVPAGRFAGQGYILGRRDNRHRSIRTSILERAILDIQDPSASGIHRWRDSSIGDRDDTLAFSKLAGCPETDIATRA